MFRSLRERRLARRQELLARRVAEFRARAERGEWFLVGASQWVDSGEDYRRTVTWARLKAQHPAYWWVGGSECWDYYDSVETQPKPQPVQQYPAAGVPQYSTAGQNHAVNVLGPTVVNYQNNGGK